MLSSYEILEAAGVVKFSPPDPNVSTLSVEERKRLFFEELAKKIWCEYPCFICPEKPNKVYIKGYKVWEETLSKLIQFYCSEEGFEMYFSPAKKSIMFYDCFSVFYGEVHSTNVKKWLNISGLLEKYFGGQNLREVFPTYNSK